MSIDTAHPASPPASDLAPPASPSPTPRREWLKWHLSRAIVLAGLDTLMLFGLGLLSLVARYGATHTTLDANQVEIPYAALCALLAPLWVGTLALSGAYTKGDVGSSTGETRHLIEGSARFVAGLAVVAYFIHLDLSRLFVAIDLPLGFVGLLVIHWMGRRWVDRRRGHGHLVQRVILVGSPEHVAQLARHLRRSPRSGIAVVGACTGCSATEVVVDKETIPVLTDPSNLVRDALSHRVSGLVVADSHVPGLPDLREVAYDLEGTGVALIVAPRVVDLAGPRITVVQVAGLPLLRVEEPRLEGPSRVIKEVLERIIAILALIVLAPLLLAMALLVRCTSKGPALYRQVRVGRGGRPFTMLKFRTMIVGADTNRPAILHLNEADGPLFKVRRDPRVTRVGRWLRRFSLDELPQIWHVATGAMSIVGPRPPLPSELATYDSHVARRLLVAPGITGLWQVSGRSDLSWDESVRLDLYYVENWSLALDLVILAKTITAVVRAKGAY